MIHKIITFLLLAMLCLIPFAESLHVSQESLLILNMKDEVIPARSYRSARTPFKRNETTVDLTREGLDSLNISGSGQFSKKSLEIILKDIDWSGPFYLVDLRKECHGFINGDAVSWYTFRNWGNKEKVSSQILEEEEHLIYALNLEKEVTFYKIISKEIEEAQSPLVESIATFVLKAETEEKLADALQLNYVRMGTTDHMKPDDSAVECFVEFVKGLPSDAWVHFHCSAGVGRTTTAMVMFDTMKNAKTLTFEQILERQAAIGGKNLAEIGNSSEEKSWKCVYFEERYQFLKLFYAYCQQNDESFSQPWSSFKKI